MKKGIVIASKILIFVLIFGLLTQRMSLVVQVLGTRKDEPDRRSCLFFELPRDTVDCLFIGTSHVYCSYIPKQIYDEYGITSASLATSAQSFQNTYWLLKEALRYQNPKVVVMDVHSITTVVDEKVKNFRLHFTSGISAMPDMSFNKIKAYKDITRLHYGWSDNMSVYDAYGMLEYKSDYARDFSDRKELLRLLLFPEKEYRTFGFYATDSVYPIENLVPHKKTHNYMDINGTVEFEYLQKIYQLLKEKDITLVLTRAPYTMPEFDDYQLYDQLFEWIESEEIIMVDFFNMIDELSINLRTDFRDADHLNYIGATKTTAWIGKYLVENMELTDHRGDSRYKLWENMFFDYQEVTARIKESVH